eukprot:scaffold375_cov210-Pinguiococcus_pyrenoidosus.AAC.4
MSLVPASGNRDRLLGFRFATYPDGRIHFGRNLRFRGVRLLDGLHRRVHGVSDLVANLVLLARAGHEVVGLDPSLRILT